METNNQGRTTARHPTATEDKVIQLPQALTATTTGPLKITQDITSRADGKIKADGKIEADGKNNPVVVAAQAQDTIIHRDQAHRPDVRGKNGKRLMRK